MDGLGHPLLDSFAWFVLDCVNLFEGWCLSAITSNPSRAQDLILLCEIVEEKGFTSVSLVWLVEIIPSGLRISGLSLFSISPFFTLSTEIIPTQFLITIVL